MKEPPSENEPLRNQNTRQANTGGLEDRDMNSMFKVLPTRRLHNLNLF